ncbi:MAG: NADP-dependent phosphogluconate dehydrogenase, partial [Aeriscardovia sp.]|nr:NADP-dependent phosphogluconate dehydrogenase [Aeriscardovia sp.]
HNGIEYALMGAIAEVYDIFRREGFPSDQCSAIFRRWDEADLHGYLIEISAKVLEHKDEKTGKSFVEVVRDRARMNGTGTWTVLSALELGCSVPSIGEAVFERIFSSESDLRSAFKAEPKGPGISVDSSEAMQALYLAFASIYAQGFDLLLRASKKYDWALDAAKIAEIWEAGCIIRSSFLPKIHSAFKKDPELASLMADPAFKAMEEENGQSMRRVVARGILGEVPCAVLDSALSYLDELHHPLPANLIGAQRDYFGAHGYERTDEEGSFHTEWEKGGKEVKRQ